MWNLHFIGSRWFFFLGGGGLQNDTKGQATDGEWIISHSHPRAVSCWKGELLSPIGYYINCVRLINYCHLTNWNMLVKFNISLYKSLHILLDPKTCKMSPNNNKPGQFWPILFGNRFGGAEGPVIYEAYFCTVFNLFENDPSLKPFWKKPRIHSTGLETGCKPVLL